MNGIRTLEEIVGERKGKEKKGDCFMKLSIGKWSMTTNLQIQPYSLAMMFTTICILHISISYVLVFFSATLTNTLINRYLSEEKCCPYFSLIL